MNYLVTGLLIYTIIAVVNFENFKKSSLMGVMRGVILGVFLWPLAVAFLALEIKQLRYALGAYHDKIEKM